MRCFQAAEEIPLRNSFSGAGNEGDQHANAENVSEMLHKGVLRIKCSGSEWDFWVESLFHHNFRFLYSPKENSAEPATIGKQEKFTSTWKSKTQPRTQAISVVWCLQSDDAMERIDDEVQALLAVL